MFKVDYKNTRTTSFTLNKYMLAGKFTEKSKAALVPMLSTRFSVTLLKKNLQL